MAHRSAALIPKTQSANTTSPVLRATKSLPVSKQPQNIVSDARRGRFRLPHTTEGRVTEFPLFTTLGDSRQERVAYQKLFDSVAVRLTKPVKNAMKHLLCRSSLRTHIVAAVLGYFMGSCSSCDMDRLSCAVGWRSSVEALPAEIVRSTVCPCKTLSTVPLATTTLQELA